MALLIAIPTAANYYGADLSSVLTLAKLSPLALQIVLGVAHFAHQPQMIQASEIVSPGWSNWVRAVVLLMFPFAGWEESLIPREVCP